MTPLRLALPWRPGLAVACCLAALAPASAAAETLSNERGRTLYAHPQHKAAVRDAPDDGARRVGSIRPRTFHGQADVVVLLEREGRWVRVRYSGLGTRVGWVPRSAVLFPKRRRSWVVIDTGRQVLSAYRGSRRLLRAKVGVGTPSSPTPQGTFFIRDKLVPRSSGGIYGPLAFGLSAYSRFRTDWPGGGQVGVHGTNQPGLIPGRISNGCVRMFNRSVRRLGRIVGPGTPVHIR